MGRFVETLAEEFVVTLYPLGSTTLERADLESGSEPDECFYLTGNKVQALRGKKRIDLNQDPAPDLIIEVDITSRKIVTFLFLFFRKYLDYPKLTHALIRKRVC